MVEKYFVERQCLRAVNSRGIGVSDSVLCLGGRVAEYPQSVTSWKNKIHWFTLSSECRELDGVGETSHVRAETFPRTHHTAGTSRSPKKR